MSNRKEGEEIGARIKAARISRGLTQEELADAAGISRPAVTMWEAGDVNNIRPKHLFRAATALGVEPQWIVTGEESKAKITQRHLTKEAMLLAEEYDSMPTNLRQRMRELFEILRRDKPKPAPKKK